MSPISVACVYIGVGPTTWTWQPIKGLVPEENWLPLPQQLSTTISFLLGVGPWTLSPFVLMCQVVWSCAGNGAVECSWKQHPCLDQKAPCLATLPVLWLLQCFHHSFLDASKPWMFILSYRCPMWVFTVTYSVSSDQPWFLVIASICCGKYLHSCRVRAAHLSGYKDDYLEGGGILPYQFSKMTGVGSPLGSIPTTCSWLDSQCQAWVPSCRVGRKSDQMDWETAKISVSREYQWT